jgi:hypothetical protein
MRGGKSTLPGRLELPFQLACYGIDGVEVAVIAAEVDDALRDRWRGCDAAIGFELPTERAGRGVKSVKIVIIAPDVNRAASNGRGGENLAFRVELPVDFCELWHCGATVNASVLRIAAKHCALRNKRQAE